MSYESKLLGVKGAGALQTSITCCNIDIVRYVIICRSPIYIYISIMTHNLIIYVLEFDNQSTSNFIRDTYSETN